MSDLMIPFYVFLATLFCVYMIAAPLFLITREHYRRWRKGRDAQTALLKSAESLAEVSRAVRRLQVPEDVHHEVVASSFQGTTQIRLVRRVNVQPMRRH